MSNSATLEKIISLCKRKGFVFQSAEIYGGSNGLYDYGHLGVLMKENIKKEWKKSLQNSAGEIFFCDGSIIGMQTIWAASGHLENFNDPMIDCCNCKKRFRADDDNINIDKACSNCGIKNWTSIRNFNLMFKTQLGALEDAASNAYLRPETAQSIFINFKNIVTTNRTQLPFGVAQIGKAFRNEITPKQFLFRMREFEQMELEWFCNNENSQSQFEFWQNKRLEFYNNIGIDSSKLRLAPHPIEKLSHYSQATTDIEYLFPFGWKELEGIAHRGNFDLTVHSKASGKDLSFYNQVKNSAEIPTVIESSVGLDRLFLTLLFDSYSEDIVNNETRILLKLSPKIAPIKIAFLPLVNKLSAEFYKIYCNFKNENPELSVQFDDSGSIGKRYRRQDEIGTPYCITFDYESCNDNKVTLRHRDTTQQERIKLTELNLKKLI